MTINYLLQLLQDKDGCRINYEQKHKKIFTLDGNILIDGGIDRARLGFILRKS